MATSRSREGYLWTTSSTAVEGLETDAVVSSTNTTNAINDEYDVVVIGAGFAGLVAARDLSLMSRRGGDGVKPLRVLLVEGRDRIGGRTWTAKALGEEFEMGGTWVHWNQPHVYNELHRYGLHKNLKTSSGTTVPETTLYRPTGGPIQQVDGPASNASADRIAAKFFEIDGHTSRTLMPCPHDPMREPAPWKLYDHWTVKQRLDQLVEVPKVERDMFEALANTLGSAPAAETGFTELLRWYALGGHSMSQMFELAGVYKIGKGGMTSLAKAILNDYDGDLLMSTVVSEIKEDKAGKVVVLTSDGRHVKAKAVISTIPLNCLSTIAFSPPLSDLRQQAIATGHINRGAKMHFKISTPQPSSPWFATCLEPPDTEFAFAFSDHNGTQPDLSKSTADKAGITPTSTTTSTTYCIAFGYSGHLTDKRDHEHIISEFQRSFNPDCQVEAYLTHDWMNDPLAKGVWCCWGPDCMAKYLEELQRPHGRRILFASADWADGWRGFVDGAIEQGKKAAADVRRLLDEESK